MPLNCVYQCVVCSSPCTFVISGVLCLPSFSNVVCPGEGKKARWARLVSEESAQIGAQQLKQAIANVKENISIIEQRACV